MISLLTFLAQAHARDMDSMDELTNNVVDNLLDRALKMSHTADMDNGLLGKPGNLAISPATNVRPAVMPRPSALSNHPASPLSHVHQSPVHFSPTFHGQALSGRNVHVKAEAATIDAKVVKQLRDSTGAGMMQCKNALKETGGDVEKAAEYLKKKGIASAEKKADRGANEGIVEAYIHAGAKLGVMVELNCETDFVAKNPEFKDLARSLAMQVAASPSVEVVSEKDMDEAFIQKEKDSLMQAEDMQSKPPEIREKMVEGRLKKIFKEKTLMDQAYIKDPDQSVEDLIKSSIAKFGENIKVGRFVRFKMGD